MRYVLIIISLSFFLPEISAQNGTLKGRVANRINNEPLEKASVKLQGISFGTLTDSSGFFELKDIPFGLYNVQVDYLGFETYVAFEIQLYKSKEVLLDIAMIESDVESEEVQIVASPFNKTMESPVSLRTIGVNEIERNPGGQRDISRVVQSLPGVSTIGGFRNDIIIRAGAPGENKFYIDGVETPVINHFTTQGGSGGPVGMLNATLIRELNFYSGAFPANRGNALSSVMDIRLKNGRADRPGITATLGSSDAGITLEGPLFGNTTVIASARRSYLKYLFSALGLPFLPTYNDFNFKSHTKFNKRNELTLLGIAAVDDFQLNGDSTLDSTNLYLVGYESVNTQNYYTAGAVFRHYGDRDFHTFVLSRNSFNNRYFKYENNDDSNPNGLISDYNSNETENKLRWEHAIEISGFKINYGLGYEFDQYSNLTYQRISVPSGIDTVNLDSKMNFHKYSAFLNTGKKLLNDKLVLSAGLRIDGTNYSRETSNPLRQFSPRLSGSWNFAPQFSFNFSTGVYHQLPTYTVLGYRDNEGVAINRDNGIQYIQSNQFAAGFEYSTKINSKFSVEGFYKSYNKYPLLITEGVSLANLTGKYSVLGNEPALPDSRGHSYGLEFLAQQKLIKGFFGILSFTFVRSEFTDAYGTFLPSTWDNRYIFALTLGKKIKKTWEVGLKWRYLGGTPYTAFNTDRSSQIPVWNITGHGVYNYDETNALRLPDWHRLEMRIDKKFFFRRWTLNLYLDVQNVYGFKATQEPILDMVRGTNGIPIPDPMKPGYYQPNLMDYRVGSRLTSIGIILDI